MHHSRQTKIESAASTVWTGVLCLLLLTVLNGCASTRCAPGRPQIDAQLQARVASGLGPSQCGETSVPEDVLLDDGVTADEAVAVAL